jgi:hypothetical protein
MTCASWWRLEVEDDVDEVDVDVDEVRVEEAVTSGREYASQKRSRWESGDRPHPCRPQVRNGVDEKAIYLQCNTREVWVDEKASYGVRWRLYTVSRWESEYLDEHPHACVLYFMLNHLKYSTRASLILWFSSPWNIKVALNVPCISYMK